MNRNRFCLLLFKAKSKSLRIVVLEETYHSDAETRLTDRSAPPQSLIKPKVLTTLETSFQKRNVYLTCTSLKHSVKGYKGNFRLHIRRVSMQWSDYCLIVEKRSFVFYFRGVRKPIMKETSYFYSYRYRQSLRVAAKRIWRKKPDAVIPCWRQRSVTIAVAGIGRPF